MSSYLVTTPGNPGYSGKVYGIVFTNGRAYVSEQTIDKKLGWTVEQIAFSMKHDFGYEVLELAQPANLPIVPPETTDPIPAKAVHAEAAQGIPVLKELPEIPPKPKRNASKAAPGAGVKELDKDSE